MAFAIAPCGGGKGHKLQRRFFQPVRGVWENVWFATFIRIIRDVMSSDVGGWHMQLYHHRW